MNKGSNELIRNINTTLILQTIIQEKSISRASLAKQLNLSKATVSSIVQNLMEQQLIREMSPDNTDTGRTSGQDNRKSGSESGRRPILLEFCPENGYILSLDLRLHSIPAIISDMAGNIYRTLNIPNHADGNQIIPLLISLIEKMTSLIPPCPHGIIGISLAIHGVVHDGVVLFAPYYPYENIDFVRALEDHFRIPVFVENEANLAVLGEHACSPQFQNLASLSIHSGVGLGLLIQNHLFKGSRGYAGEFGHTTIEVNGRPCPCGNRGCLEQYLSEDVLLKTYAKTKAFPEINLATILQDYENNDPVAVEMITQFLQYISVSIHNIQHIINPEAIIINSRITAALPQTLPQLQKMLSPGGGGRCPVLYSSLQDKAALLGGVVYCMKEFADIDMVL